MRSASSSSIRSTYSTFLLSMLSEYPSSASNGAKILVDRKFTTLDLFPSTLAALGCQIQGNRLGLGVNLFSGERTLSEQYGYEYLFQEIRKQSASYNKLMLGSE